MKGEFYKNGHHYKVTKIEGSDDYTIVKDGRWAARVDKETARLAVEKVERLF